MNPLYKVVALDTIVATDGRFKYAVVYTLASGFSFICACLDADTAQMIAEALNRDD